MGKHGAVHSKIFIVSGPSGAGKTTVIKKLLARPEIRLLLMKTVSYTTRLPRKGEREGKDYFFVDRARFDSRARRNFFLEWKRVFGDCYGTPRYFVQGARRFRKHLLLCIDVKGALQVKKEYRSQAVLIFIQPPSLEELKKRLGKRNTETAQSLSARLLLAQKEISVAKKYDYCIINDALKDSVEALGAIIRAEQYRRCLS